MVCFGNESAYESNRLGVQWRILEPELRWARHFLNEFMFQREKESKQIKSHHAYIGNCSHSQGQGTFMRMYNLWGNINMRGKNGKLYLIKQFKHQENDHRLSPKWNQYNNSISPKFLDFHSELSEMAKYIPKLCMLSLVNWYKLMQTDKTKALWIHSMEFNQNV